MSLGDNNFNFRISIEGKTYEFDLRTTSTGSGRYSILPKNESDLSVIKKLIQRAFDENPSSIEDLSRELRHIPSVTYVSVCPTSKTNTVGVQQLQQATPKPSLSEKAALIDQRLQGYCKERGFQGAVLVIENGKVSLQKGYGISSAGGDPITDRTPLPIASLTKPIVGMAVLDMVASGRFESIQNPARVKITDFLPENCLPTDPEVLDTWKSVSLQDLLNHTSGLPSFPEYGAQLMKAKGGDVSNPLSPLDAINLIRDRKIKGGSEYCYSNFGYHLVGKMIEHVSGQSFEKEINAFLSSKGCESSGYVGTGSVVLPNPMKWNGTQTVNIDEKLAPLSEAYSSGGLYSTVEDLAKLIGSIQTSDSLKQTGHVTEHGQDFRPNYNCSFGWNISTGSEHTEIWKNGAIDGFGSLLVSYPETNSAFIVLSNCQAEDVEPFIGRELSDILTSDSAESAQKAMSEKVQRMRGENKKIAKQSSELDIKKKRNVARGCWEKYVSSGRQEDLWKLKHFLSRQYPDPLFIQKELDEAVKSRDYERFVALFEPLSVDLAGLIAKEEGIPSVAARQLDNWLNAFNSGERSKVQVLQQGFKVPQPSESINGLLQLFDRVQGFNLIEIKDETATGITAVLRERCAFQEYAELTIEIDPESPHKIVNAQLVPTDLPPPKVERISEVAAIEAINQKIESLAKDGRFSGTVLVTKPGERQPIVKQAVGLSNIEQEDQITIDTKFSIASCGKMFTSVLILQLVEQRKIKLHDQVGKYVKGLDSGLARATIQQLLTHTAGAGPLNEEYRAESTTVQQLIQHGKGRKPDFEPGSDWRYSNYGFTLLGGVIEAVTGKDYYQVVSEKIFQPLDMRNSSYPTKTESLENTAEGYIRKLDGLHSNRETMPMRGSPAGGAYSTVTDFNSFARGLQSGALLSPKSVELLTTPQEVSPGFRYTLGFQDGDLWFGHGGREDGVNAELRIYPKSGYVVSVMANLDPPAASDLAEFIGARLPEES